MLPRKRTFLSSQGLVAVVATLWLAGAAIVTACGNSTPPATPPATATSSGASPATSASTATATPWGVGDGDAGATSAGGFGSGSGRSQGAHAKKTPSLGQGAIHAHGRLPPDVIQRVLRQNFGRFRLCYEDLLATNDKASGHVTGEFVINRDGTVTAAKDSGSDIGDATMISCMTNHFKTITFPKPESGIVTVSYPVIFAPGE